MDLVVDANILFAALIKDGLTSELIVQNNLYLYAPEFIIEEFEKYREIIKKKTKRTDNEFDRALDLFQRRIELIPSEEIKPYVEKAIVISPDIKDVQYIALGLKLHIAIWSNDRALKEEQKKVKVYSTSEIIKL
ncbi:MAG: PIN domain protein [Candidatus Argoarchaeum ethanivorans]|uniref:PIN domain protein n=1 Tax=Candidatus Argoarchaeum ethanivorans TaxID=2608793 RepID=A0A811T5R0_9EURY|nr:MAG: PIN domain protein [Candidatus Argoarchaeum ethanivorans]